MLVKSTITKISYASASLSAALLNEFFQAKAQYFYVVEMKLHPFYWGIALGIWAIWNSINDPLAGWFMDRNTTRWGRRLPWMIGFWIPLVVSFGLIWSPPIDWVGNNYLLVIWLIVILMIFDTSYTIVILAWAALFPELFTSKEDRSVVAGLRQIFSLFALVLALVIPPYFVSDGNIPSYAFFGWILASISFVNLGFAFYGSKEPKYEEDFFKETYSLKDGVNLLLHNRTFQAFLVGNLITFFAYGQVLAMLPFYRRFILFETEDFERMAYTGAIAMTLISLVFWVWITNKKEPRFTYLFSAGFFALFLIPVWFTNDPIIVIATMALVGFGLAGQLMVVDLLLAQVVDEDYINNGIRREGLFFGFNGFFIRIAILLQAISFALVSELTGFDQYRDIQSELAQTGIKIQFIFLPIVGFLIGIFIVYKYYDIHGSKLKQQQEKLNQLMRDHRESNPGIKSE